MPLKTFDTSKVSNNIFAVPLTPEGFSAYGGVISVNEQLKKVSASKANYGTAIKLHKVAPVDSYFENAPSGQRPTTNLNVFRCAAPKRLITKRGLFKAYKSTVLERHPFSTQAFIPMGQNPNKASYLVIVSKSDESTEQKLPDPKTLKAFICRGNQSITYGAGTWHAPMVVIDEEVPYIDFAVLINENGVEEEDCQECYFEPGYNVKFGELTSRSAL